jgi:predicted Zn-dependent protease with MMP-like domain
LVVRGREGRKTQVARLEGLRHFPRWFVDVNWKKLRTLALSEVEATLAALPEPLRERAEKLPVTFEHFPNAGLQADGIKADTLGLFTGAEFADEGNVPLPPQIILFLENLWGFAEGDEEIFRDEVHTTYLHELGHYLGLDEDELTERGLE